MPSAAYTLVSEEGYDVHYFAGKNASLILLPSEK
jgi:hypothetical protein